MSAVLETVILPLNYLDMAPVVGLEPTLQVSKTRALTFELYGNEYTGRQGFAPCMIAVATAYHLRFKARNLIV